MIKRIVIFFACLLIGSWFSTTWIALKIANYAHPLGELFTIGDIPIYPPWMWFKWFYLYGNNFKTVFAKTMLPIQISILLGIALAWASRLFFNNRKVSTAHGSAKWASENNIKESGLLVDQGVILGKSKFDGKVLRHDGPEHVLAIAPTRGGKGVGLVIPTLLTWQESLVCFDPKGENWQITSGYRATLGECLYFDPTRLDTAKFNPLMEIRKGQTEVKDAQNIADILVDPDGRIDTKNHWQNAAHSLLVGTILFVLYNWPKKSLSGVVEFLTQAGKPFEESLKLMAQSDHPLIISVAQEMLNKHIEERSGVLSTAISLLSVFRDPLVANATDGHDFFVSSLKNSAKPISLYLILPPSDLSRLRVLLRIILNQIGRALTENIERSNKNDQKILFLLDEFPALGRLEFFESSLAYMAGYDLKAYLIIQSLNQLQKAYGERNSILDNCHVRIAFANNDDQTAKRLSDLLGEETAVKEQESHSGGRLSMFLRNTSISQVMFARPLMLPSEINRLPADEEIILINGCLPILANKIKYYEDKRFNSKLLKPPINITNSNQPISRETALEQQIGSAL